MLHLILLLAVLGFIAYLVITYIPMPDVVRNVIIVIVAICMILYVLQVLGFGDLAVPQIRH